MSLYSTVDCPHCKYEIDCMNIEFDGYDETDYECPNCNEEIKIVREWDPIYYSEAIEYIKCCCCGKVDRNDNLYKEDKNYFCTSCYLKIINERIERR